jgi:hypothetical protein
MGDPENHDGNAPRGSTAPQLGYTRGDLRPSLLDLNFFTLS